MKYISFRQSDWLSHTLAVSLLLISSLATAQLGAGQESAVCTDAEAAMAIAAGFNDLRFQEQADRRDPFSLFSGAIFRTASLTRIRTTAFATDRQLATVLSGSPVLLGAGYLSNKRVIMDHSLLFTNFQHGELTLSGSLEGKFESGLIDPEGSSQLENSYARLNLEGTVQIVRNKRVSDVMVELINAELTPSAMEAPDWLAKATLVINGIPFKGQDLEP